MLRIPRWLALILAVGGVVTLGVAFPLLGREGAIGGILINVGTAFLLLIPLVFLERQIEDWASTLRDDSASTQRSVAELSERVEEVRAAVTGLSDLSDSTRDLLISDRQDEQQRFDQFREAPTVDALSDLLEHALDLSAISRRGVRVKFGSEDAVLRVGSKLGSHGLVEALSPLTGHGRVMLIDCEGPLGDHLASLQWSSKKSAEEFASDLAHEMKRARVYPSDGRFPDMYVITLKRILETLQFGIDVVSGDVPGMRELGPIIQVVGNQWVITDDGIESVEPYLYTVGWPSERPHMHDHMREKAWLKYNEFWEAWEIAQGLEENWLQTD